LGRSNDKEREARIQKRRYPRSDNYAKTVPAHVGVTTPALAITPHGTVSMQLSGIQYL